MSRGITGTAGSGISPSFSSGVAGKTGIVGSYFPGSVGSTTKPGGTVMPGPGSSGSPGLTGLIGPVGSVGSKGLFGSTGGMITPGSSGSRITSPAESTGTAAAKSTDCGTALREETGRT